MFDMSFQEELDSTRNAPILSIMSISPLLIEEKEEGSEASVNYVQQKLAVGRKRKRDDTEEEEEAPNTGDAVDDGNAAAVEVEPEPEPQQQDEQQQEPLFEVAVIDDDNNNNSGGGETKQQQEGEGEGKRERHSKKKKGGSSHKKHKKKHSKRSSYAQAEWEQVQADGGVRADNLGNIDDAPLPPPPKTQEQIERDERIKGCLKRMKYGSEIDWKRVHEEDVKVARRVAAKFRVINFDRFAGDQEYCLPCRLRGKVEIGGHDPYQDLSTLVRKNYGRMGLEALLTAIQLKYVTDVLAWNSDDNADIGRFWYRKTILEHIRYHSINKHVVLFDRLHQKSNLYELGLEFVCEYDPIAQEYGEFNAKLMKPLKDVADCEMRIFNMLAKEGQLNQPI
jgi:hypothetical protein